MEIFCCISIGSESASHISLIGWQILIDTAADADLEFSDGVARLASGHGPSPHLINFIQHPTSNTSLYNNFITFPPMYLLNWLAFLPWLLPWSNACLSLNSALLSSQLKNPYSFLPSQPLVTLAGPSPAAFATDNTTKSMPPVEKKQDPDTEKTKPENAQLQDTSPCPEQEDLDCDECGGQKYDKEEGTFRCVGVRSPFAVFTRDF